MAAHLPDQKIDTFHFLGGGFFQLDTEMTDDC